MKKPIELTKEFITDYQNWNDFAYNLSETEDDESDHKIEKKYDDLILKYCSAEKKYQGISYGSDSSHCPEQEQIIEETTELSFTVVKTRFINKHFDFLTHDYEYHYILSGNKWILEELYLIDDDGKYECL